MKLHEKTSDDEVVETPTDRMGIKNAQSSNRANDIRCLLHYADANSIAGTYLRVRVMSAMKVPVEERDFVHYAMCHPEEQVVEKEASKDLPHYAEYSGSCLGEGKSARSKGIKARAEEPERNHIDGELSVPIPDIPLRGSNTFTRFFFDWSSNASTKKSREVSLNG